ncbi:energy-coupling factor transporter ATPase [Brevibacillus sp. B_LB10_24]|uniref:energy-coupling factor transporter ATPase n=1 Tax=Brevibacillus sp. B_LB10_24 TaxID=3380645 RepID=UPI0038B7B874
MSIVMPETAVVSKQLAFGYQTGQEPHSLVIKDLDLEIETGLFVSIMGHNGSGKSTLAKLLNGLLTPSSGVLVVCGYDASNQETVWEIRHHVGMVFQNPDNQIVGPTVEDDVAFGLENRGVPPEEMRVRIDEALQSVQMQSFSQAQPHRLSGGQKQRVAIAGIMAIRPSVIILDEATAMLDPMARKEVMALAHRLHREEGITVINITHFPEDTLHSDRIIVMHDGKVVLDGTPAAVFAEAPRLQAIGLDVPLAVRLRQALVSNGVAMPLVLEREELVRELCKLLSKT